MTIGTNITTTGVSLTTALVEGGAEQDEDHRAHARASAEAGEHGGGTLQGVGLEQSLADDQHRQHGHQRLVGEAGEEVVRGEGAL